MPLLRTARCLNASCLLNHYYEQNGLLLLRRRDFWSTATNPVRFEDKQEGRVRLQQRKPIVCARQRQTDKQLNDQWDQQVVLPGRTLDPRSGEIHESVPGILGHSSLRVTRQLEMMNVFLGYEQANRYALLDPHGNPVGFMAEEHSLWSIIGRQILRLHRPFRVHVLDLNGSVCLTIWRNFSFINSKIFVCDHRGRTIGESQQQWHLWRRQYNMFVDQTSTGDRFDRRQFAQVNAPFLSWDFPFLDESGEALLGGVFRDFSGIGMELFTDYGLYGICFDRLSLAQRYHQINTLSGSSSTGSIDRTPVLANRDLNLDERAVALAAAVSIDFDYFSRHSRMGGGGGFMFFPFSTSNDITDIDES